MKTRTVLPKLRGTSNTMDALGRTNPELELKTRTKKLFLGAAAAAILRTAITAR